MALPTKERLKRLLMTVTARGDRESADAAVDLILEKYHPTRHVKELIELLDDPGLNARTLELVLTLLFRIADKPCMKALVDYAVDVTKPRKAREQARLFTIVLRIWTPAAKA